MKDLQIGFYARLVMLIVLPVGQAVSQCVGLPSVMSLGSNKFPVGLCAPVKANVTYTLSFTSPVPSGTLELVYDWGDGTPEEVISLATLQTAYNASRTHDFPAESDCEYFVTMTIRYNGQWCTNTRQVQKISSWRTEAFNGADVKLVSPVTELKEHQVCEGDAIDVVFRDGSHWSCNANYVEHETDTIESPNAEYRWSQIVYNTSVTGNKIPNIKVSDVQMTDGNGNDVLTNYQDPRGVFYMAAPVVVHDSRRRPALRITAPGGSGPNAPKAGDVFEITLRYWNFCNPYDDPAIPGPPADLINGDHMPVQTNALIKIVAAAPPPVVASQNVCFGTTPAAFTVTGVPVNSIVNWYENVPGPDRPGSLISSGKATSLPITSHPAWVNNKTNGIYSLWVSYEPKVIGAANCESPKVLITRTIREDLVVPNPVSEVPSGVCNNSFLTITMPPPVTESIGGATQYTWTGSTNVSVNSSTINTATFKINVTNFGTALFVDRTITVNRKYTGTLPCSKSKVFNIRIYKPGTGGTLSAVADVCETSLLDTIRLSGHTGSFLRWEVKKNQEAYVTYDGPATASTVFPGLLTPGVYKFRAVISNGACPEVYSTEEQVQVFSNPAAAVFAGKDQFICAGLSSAPLGASNPSPGTGTWSYISSVPAGLPSPTFSTNVHDPNTTVSVNSNYAGTYTLRWLVSNGLCTSYDDVVIDFGTTPSDAYAGQDKATCGPATTLDGNVPDKGIGTWTVVSGPAGCTGAACAVAVTTPSSAASAVTLTGNVYGAYVFRWTIASGGNDCFTKHDDVTITFNRPVQISATDIDTLCLDAGNLTPIALSGIIEGGAISGTWKKVSGKGTVSASTVQAGQSIVVNATYTPVYEDYVTGSPVQVKLVSTPEAGSSCPAVEKGITIVIDRKPVAHAGADVTAICDDSIQLNAETPLYGATGVWTTTQPGVIFDNPADPHTLVRHLPSAPSNTVVTWTLTSASGQCVSAPASVTLTRVIRPPFADLSPVECEMAPAGAPVTTQIVLKNYENSVTSLAATNRVITWYKDAAPPMGTVVVNTAGIQKDIVTGQKYIARIRDPHTDCTSDATVTVEVRPLPRAEDAVVSLCEDVVGSNTAAGVNLNEAQYKAAITTAPNVDLTWFSNEIDAQQNNAPITTPFTVTGGRDVYARVAYNDTQARCSDIAKLSLNVNSLSAITTIFGRESVCQGNPSQLNTSAIEIYQVTPVEGAKYYWNIPADANAGFKVFGGGRENDFYVMLQFPNVYQGKISVRVETKGCSSPVIEKEIIVSPTPVKPVIKGGEFVCENDQRVAFTVTPNNSPSSSYTWEARRVSDNTIGGAYVVDGQSTGNVLVNFQEEDVILSVRENNAVCVSPSSSKTISVKDRPLVKAKLEKDISCFQRDDGSIRVEVQGGTAPYADYILEQTGQSDPDKNGIFDHLSQGSYSIKVKDAKGCTSVSNTLTLTAPSQVVIQDVKVWSDINGYNLSSRDAADGEVKVTFSGGQHTGIYTVTLTNANDPSHPIALQGQKDLTFAGLRHGNYTVVVADANGCESIPSVAVIANPPVFNAGLVGFNQSICSGEDPAVIKELVSPSGGVGNYVYEWQESTIGDVNNDAVWTTISGADKASYDPPVLTTLLSQGAQRFYRRLVRSVSTRGDVAHEVKGKDSKVIITVNPIPQVKFSAASTEVCGGEPALLNIDLQVGTGPITYDYVAGAKTISNQIGAANTIIPLSDIEKNTTYVLLRVKDFNGCAVKQLPQPVSIKVIHVAADFTIINDKAQCSGGEYRFTWKVEEGIDYRWEWADGTTEELKAGKLATGRQTIAHRFMATSGQVSSVYPVKLFAKSKGCQEKFVTKSVTVHPDLALNISAGDTLLCSGETVTFQDQSVGVDFGKWYYHERGTNTRLEEQAGAQRQVSFTLKNTTAKNPIVYEVVYEAANNEGCTGEYRNEVVVYRNITAAFAAGEIPVFTGGVSEVLFTNTSLPKDENDFEYVWSFGQHASATWNEERQAFQVGYFSAGVKEVTLTATNIDAREAGRVCQHMAQKQIEIKLPELNAAFTATPMAGCFPVNVEVENQSPGADTFFWRLYDEHGLVTTSNLSDPVFRIVNPGTYSLHLIASYALTGQSDSTVLKGIEVMDVPLASFATRATPVFAPDTPVEPFNYSERANFYHWDFGDGYTSSDFEPKHAYNLADTYSVMLVAGYDHGTKDIDGDGIADYNVVCYDTTRRDVVAIDGSKIQIPNAFTPNLYGPSGGIPSSGTFNDVFLPIVKGVLKFSMQIFDRWGTLVFESYDQHIGWDGYDKGGRLMHAGVYVYKLSLDFPDGERTTRIGDITLIR